MPSQSVMFQLVPNMEILAEASPTALQDAMEALSDFQGVLDYDIRTMQSAAQLGFATQGATFGDLWPELKPGTIAEKRRLGYDATPEVRTGRLRDAEGATVEQDGNSVTVGTDLTEVPYAAWQDTGVESHNLPPRALYMLTDGEIDTMQEELAQYLANTGLPPGAITIEPTMGDS